MTQLSEERLRDLHNPDCLFTTHNGKCDCPYGPVIESAATLMRDKCVEKVKAMRAVIVKRNRDRDESNRLDSHRINLLDAVIEQLRSLDQVKQGEM